MSRVQTAVILVIVLAFVGVPAAAEDSVRIQPDIVYGHKDGLALTFDVLQPLKPNGAGVLFIQSGGWYSAWGDPVRKVSFCRRLLDKGFTVFLVRHGSAPRYAIFEAVADVRRSVRFIRKHAADWTLRRDKLGAMGISAGGHLTLMLATTADDGDPQAEEELLRHSSRLEAVVAICPPTDLREWVSNPPQAIREHRALQVPLKMDAATARDCSPIVHVNAHTAPTLLIHGEKDTLVPTEHSQHMMEALKNAKVASDLLVVKGAGHGNVEHDRGVMPAIVEWFEAQLQVDRR